ncbi:histone acetyltransferase [Balamuthia mandrillaris]
MNPGGQGIPPTNILSSIETTSNVGGGGPPHPHHPQHPTMSPTLGAMSPLPSSPHLSSPHYAPPSPHHYPPHSHHHSHPVPHPSPHSFQPATTSGASSHPPPPQHHMPSGVIPTNLIPGGPVSPHAGVITSPPTPTLSAAEASHYPRPQPTRTAASPSSADHPAAHHHPHHPQQHPPHPHSHPHHYPPPAAGGAPAHHGHAHHAAAAHHPHAHGGAPHPHAPQHHPHAAAGSAAHHHHAVAHHPPHPPHPHHHTSPSLPSGSMHPSSHPTADARPTEDTLPFEKPTITQMLKNFVVFKYAQFSEQERTKVARIFSLLIHSLNALDLPNPSSYDSLFSTNSNMSYLYSASYQKWLRYCRGSGAPEGRTFKLTDIFGKTFFRLIWKVGKDSVMQRCLQFKDTLSAVAAFLGALEKELFNDQSFIFQLMRPRPQGALAKPPSAPSPTTGAGASTAGGTTVAPPPLSLPPSAMMAGKRPAIAPVEYPRKKARTEGPEGSERGLAPSRASTLPPPHMASPSSSLEMERVPSSASAGRATPLLHEGEEYMASTVAMVKVEPTPMPTTVKGQGKLLGPETASGSTSATTGPTEVPGVLNFRVIKNDGKKQHIHWLLRLKKIFSTQLPKMPREYIARLVFDWRHRSILIMKQDKVIGGITFRPFYEQGFLEIAFCAITAEEQVKGYGSHLMNHLKEYAKTQKIYHFLTYADNFAVGYFKKQGFTREVTLDKKRWVGFIKDYDGGTPMECVIHPRVNYVEMPNILKKQREILLSKIRELSNSHIVHKGLDIWKKSGYPQRILLSAIPGIDKSTFRVTNTGDDVLNENMEALHLVLRDVLEEAKNHEMSWPFREPVSAKEVPDYYDVIKDPIDLSTIESRLDSGQYYITKEIFLADIKRMCDNCRTYNSKETVYYQCAETIEQFVDELFLKLSPPTTSMVGHSAAHAYHPELRPKRTGKTLL